MDDAEGLQPILKRCLDRIMISLIPGLIVWIGIVSWSFALTKDWPPQYLLVSASIGGMVSPYLWGFFRWVGDRLKDQPEG